MTEIIEDGQEVEVDLMMVDAAPTQGGVFVCGVVDAASVKFKETSDGYLAFEANFARTGIQEYLASELGIVGDTVKRIYRPESSVFDAASFRTFSSRPITLEHPPELVTPDNAKQYAVGWTGTKIKRDGDMIRGSGIVTDRDAIDAIKSGKARQLSMGYTLTIDMTAGTTPEGEAYDGLQRNLRMNHLAIVPRARGGSKLKIGDTRKEHIMTDKLTAVVIDGASVNVAEDGAEAVRKLIADAEKAKADLATAQAQAATDKADWDKEKAALDTKVDKLKAEKLDDADLDAMIADRAKLLNDAAKVAPDFKVDGVSAEDIRKGVVASVLGDDAVSDKSTDYITARFDGLVDAGDSNGDPFSRPIRKTASDAETGGWGNKVFDAAGVKMKEA